VEVILNGPAWQRYQSRRDMPGYQQAGERWGFHRTTDIALSAILRNGFEIGGQGVPIRNGRVAGNGLYLANSPDLSLHFTGSTRKMIMAQFWVRGGRQDRDAWVIANNADVYPRYVLHF